MEERDAEGWYRLGNEHRDGGREKSAADCFERTIALDPLHARAWNNLGVARELLGRPDLASAAYRRAVELDRELVQAYLNLAHMASAAGDRAGAERWYRAGLEQRPDEPNLRHMLASLLGQTTERPPEGHVASLFDDMARGFDSHLQGQLGYRVPADLARLVAPLLKHAAPALVIDLGCGTGLVGEALAGMGARIVGIDLSARMLERAAQRGAYERLEKADAVAGLLREPAGSAHAVLAADVFIYMGDLGAVFAAASRVLAPGGLFAFSIEDADQGDYSLRSSGRYAHSPAYVRALASRSALEEKSLERAGLRREGLGVMAGWLGCFAKRAG